MPTERLSMRHIREVLRLHYSVGMSQHAVSRSLGPGIRKDHTANADLWGMNEKHQQRQLGEAERQREMIITGSPRLRSSVDAHCMSQPTVVGHGGTLRANDDETLES